MSKTKVENEYRPTFQEKGMKLGQRQHMIVFINNIFLWVLRSDSSKLNHGHNVHHVSPKKGLD